MSPDILASLLDANPYPGCVVTRPLGDVRLNFDGLTIVYRADGWHFDGLHLESTLSDHSAPEQVHPEIRRILKVVMSLKVGRALGEAETLRSEDPVEYLTDLAAEKMLAILDVAALANARQAKIASNVAEAAARDMRIADLERTIEATHKVFDGVGVAWSVGSDAGRLTLPKRAEFAVEPDTLTNTERAALEARIADLERDLAAKDDALKTAHAALKRICEVIGAPAPCVAEDAVEAVKTLLCESEGHNARATTAEGDIREIALALNDAGAPAVYDMPDDTERPIPDLERIRILGARVRTDRAEREQEALRAQRHADYLRDAHVELDYCGAPRHADGVAITPAARIRAYVDMVTTPTEDPSIALREWTRTVWGGDDTL